MTAGPQFATVWTAELASIASSVAVGVCLVQVVAPSSPAGFFVPATSANRTANGRTVGIALTAGDVTNPAVQFQVAGFVPASITGLGPGTQSWVRASAAAGIPERCTPGVGDDIIGYCETDGSLHLALGFLTSAIIAGGGGGGGTPWHNVPMAAKSASYTLTSSDYAINFVTNPNLVATLPAAPSNGDAYEVAAQTTGCSVSGNGHNINGAATYSLVQYQSTSFIYDGTTSIWVAA